MKRLEKKRFRNLWRVFFTFIVASTSAVSLHAEQSAFPGAIGYGKDTTGWRGGQIIAVTNLQDRGKGSLRECAEELRMPRICVFQVSGTISLDTPIRLRSNLYVAGQTAPGQGIQIKLRGGDHTPIIIKNSGHVLVRYLKIRPGAGTRESANIDAVTVESSSNIYLDALSMQFASDETFNIHTNNNPTHKITLARSILSHSLDRSVHPKGRHSKGALICSNEGSLEQPTPCGAITLAGNLFAHNRDRNPDVKGTDIGPIEIVNNIFYNAISQFGEFYDLMGDVTINYVGNIVKTGPSSNRRQPLPAVEAFDWDEQRGMKIYEADNINYERKGCGNKAGRAILDEEAEKHRIDAPSTPLTFPPLPAAEVEEAVLAKVGAARAGWGGPDNLDQRAIDDFITCKGKIIDTPEDVDGWPDLPEEKTALVDTDEDGLPDDWEAEKDGLDPRAPNQTWEDRDGDGWSNIEEYLSFLAEDRI
ncbi:hypothetical protein OU789_05970 [Halocynthiibacter sp. C4]|uniref:pectate lyase family protein n=1 Tax=Halocynthiibacter sp. C4 TaxID=2992758 RepID=UPI00237BC011|nr:hypothetical protein [Halocynthiibacter sp. C4]MDE0589464.1 hypothetical protein [Halocynthiibacter sp. C4]